MYSELENPKTFDKFCKDYWKDHRSWFSDMSYDEYKNFMKEDGIQDVEESWYINKYLKEDKKKIDNAWNRYKESSKDGIRMMRDLIGNMPDDYGNQSKISDEDISDILNNMYWLNFNDLHSRVNLIY